MTAWENIKDTVVDCVRRFCLSRSMQCRSEVFVGADTTLHKQRTAITSLSISRATGLAFPHPKCCALIPQQRLKYLVPQVQRNDPWRKTNADEGDVSVGLHQRGALEPSTLVCMECWAQRRPPSEYSFPLPADFHSFLVREYFSSLCRADLMSNSI